MYQALHWACAYGILLHTHNNPKKYSLLSYFTDQKTDKRNSWSDSAVHAFWIVYFSTSGNVGPCNYPTWGWQKATLMPQKLSGVMDRKRRLMTPRTIYTALELCQQKIRLKCKQTHKSKKNSHTIILLMIFLALRLGSNKTMFPPPGAQWGGTAPVWSGRPTGSVAASIMT